MARGPGPELDQLEYPGAVHQADSRPPSAGPPSASCQLANGVLVCSRPGRNRANPASALVELPDNRHYVKLAHREGAGRWVEGSWPELAPTTRGWPAASGAGPSSGAGGAPNAPDP